MNEIVLNEREKAEQSIKEHSLGAFPFETLTRVAKYYIDVEKISKREAREKLAAYLLSCDPRASVPKWDDTLDRAVSKATRYPLIDIPYVGVTQPEMDIIDSLKTSAEKRFAFTLLCLAKYHTLINNESNYWVKEEAKHIMKLANINMTVERQDMMYHSLYKDGLIALPKSIDNLSCQVLFVREDGDVILKIDDFRNLGWQYEAYKGGSFYRCTSCGKYVKANKSNVGRPAKYCPECAKKIHAIQQVESNRRMRAAAREQSVHTFFQSDDKNYASEQA